MGAVKVNPVHANGKAARPLQFIIVGAGIAGLTVGLGLQNLGHKVLILEQAAQFVETGAGIQIAPNAARILERLGVLVEVLRDADILERISLRRYADDEVLGLAPLMPDAKRRYGAPACVMHRGDLQHILVVAAKTAGCRIVMSSRVVRADTAFSARVQTSDNTWYEGDVVLAGDGIKSCIRASIAAAYGQEESLVPTGDAAYRLLIPRDRVQGHQEALKLLDQNTATRWIGPDGHIMAYPIKHNSLYNVVLVHPEKPMHLTPHGQDAAWTLKRDRTEMVEFYQDWSTSIQLLLSQVLDDEIMEWRLYSHAPLARWVKNRVALIGDACHPMLPYTAQGAANAIEDAGALVAAFACTDDACLALGVYEEARKGRGETMQADASAMRTRLHLHDGEAQRSRDDAITKATMAFEQAPLRNPDLWADSRWQDDAWGVDVMEYIMQEWEALVARVEARRCTDCH